MGNKLAKLIDVKSIVTIILTVVFSILAIRAVKLTYGTADGTSANGYNDTGAGYTIIPNRPTYHNYITKMQFNEKGYFPSALGATDSTYWSDYFFGRTYYALFGGGANDGAKAGANEIYLGDAFSHSSWDDTAALSCKPSVGAKDV